jgi:hypothetical protein
MGIPRGYKKTSDDMKFYYSSPRKQKKTKPKDSLPKGMTAKEFKEKYAKVVWCDYYACIHNESPEGASRKIGTRVDMSKFLQNGSAIGGSIESQSGDQGYTNYSFGSKWEGK